MQLNRSRVFLFAPLATSAFIVGACAAIEQPDNEALEALKLLPTSTASATSSSTATTTTTTAPPATTPASTDVPPEPSATDTTVEPPASSPGSVSSAQPLPTGAPTDTAAATSSVPPAATPTDGTASTAPPPSTPATTTAAATQPPAAGTGGAPLTLPDPIPSGGSDGAGGAASDAGTNCGEDLGVLADAVKTATTISAQYVTYDTNVTSQTSFHIRLSNDGLMNVSLKNITVRYWLTTEVAMSKIVLDSVPMFITGAKVTLKETPDGTQQYLEITYPDVSLMRGAQEGQTDIGVRLEPVMNTDNIQNDQENDWSWAPKVGAWGDNPKVTVYRTTTDVPAKAGLLAGSSPCD